MGKRNLLGGVAACVLAASTAFGAAGAAHASPEYTSCDGGCTGRWEKVGPNQYRFELKDAKADGLGVMGYLTRKDGSLAVEPMYNGAGEGQVVTFTRDAKPGELEAQMCTVDGPEHIKKVCSDKLKVE